MNNPETEATLTLERYEGTIETLARFGTHKTQDEDKQNKKHNTEIKKDEQHGPTKTIDVYSI